MVVSSLPASWIVLLHPLADLSKKSLRGGEVVQSKKRVGKKPPPKRYRIAAGVASLEDVVVVEAPAREEEVVDVEVDEGVEEVRTVASGIVRVFLKFSRPNWYSIELFGLIDGNKFVSRVEN